MKKFILSLAVALCATTATMAEVSVSGGADLVSTYTWRGMKQSGPAIQPGMSVSAGGFSVGAWGSAAFDQSAVTSKELDMTVGYEIGGFALSFTDYWWAGENTAYFLEGTHQQELTASYGFDCGLSLSWSTMIAGDLDKNANGDQYYSSYIGLGYSCMIADVVGCDLSLGINPWKSQWGKGGVSNIAVRFSKDLLSTETFTLPFFVETSVSPVQSEAYLLAGLSFGF